MRNPTIPPHLLIKPGLGIKLPDTKLQTETAVAILLQPRYWIATNMEEVVNVTVNGEAENEIESSLVTANGHLSITTDVGTKIVARTAAESVSPAFYILLTPFFLTLWFFPHLSTLVRIGSFHPSLLGWTEVIGP